MIKITAGQFIQLEDKFISKRLKPLPRGTIEWIPTHEVSQRGILRTRFKSVLYRAIQIKLKSKNINVTRYSDPASLEFTTC